MSLKVDIRKKFKGFTLEVDFASDGTPMGILGASGSGKSLTLKCIAGVETPDEGIILLNDRVLFDSANKINLKPQERKIGYLFQNYALFPHMTVEENIGCALAVKDKADRKNKIHQLIGRFALEGKEKHYPGHLSGGQQQRVALARILAYEPEMLLLDEPFSALDAFLKEQLQLEMLELLEGYEGESVLVTHSRDEAYKLCQNLMILEQGRKLEMGATKQMFEKPKKLQAAKVTGCKNFSTARKAGENLVEAIDWQLILQVGEKVPDNLTHIGIRAHDFVPAPESATNRIEVQVVETVEGPFEWSVIFTNKPAGKSQEAIWWKYNKTHQQAEVPRYLSIAPEKILLLEEE